MVSEQVLGCEFKSPVNAIILLGLAPSPPALIVQGCPSMTFFKKCDNDNSKIEEDNKNN